MSIFPLDLVLNIVLLSKRVYFFGEMNKKLILIVVGAVVALTVVGITIFLLRSRQDTRSRAQTPIGGSIPSPSPTSGAPNAFADPPPPAPQNVLVEYPSCEGTRCSFLSASCAWDPVTIAVNYQLKVTEVDTGTIIYNQNQGTSVSKIVFPISQNKVYQCDVVAINANGAQSEPGTHSLLCETDGIIEDTPTPTAPPPTIPPTKAPTATPVASVTATMTPTVPVKLTGTPSPTIEAPGNAVQSFAIISGAVMTLIMGVLLLAM